MRRFDLAVSYGRQPSLIITSMLPILGWNQIDCKLVYSKRDDKWSLSVGSKDIIEADELRKTEYKKLSSR